MTDLHAVSRRAWAAATVSIVLWAAAFPAIRVAVSGYQPATLVTLRLLIASLALALAAPFLGLSRPGQRDLPLLALSGLLGMAGYQFLLNWGEQTMSAATASLLIATSPAYSVLLAAAVLKERLTPRRAIGVGVAFTGAVMIALGGGGTPQLEPGTLVLAGAALAYGTYHVAHRPLLVRYSGMAVTCYATWFATLLALPAFGRLPAALVHAGLDATAAAIFLGLGSSAVAFTTWAYAVHRLGVGAAATSLYLTPAVALPVTAVWLGERPYPVELAGGAIALIGVAIANRQPSRTYDLRAAPQAPPRVTPVDGSKLRSCR